ncbi:MAG: lipid-A-disaccharide synthase [Paracoccaceae bacterium]|jgi:lipid-A-disaccharide synthase
MKESLTFFVIAGESSGDRLGAALMQGLRSEYAGTVKFVGVGGPLMIERGLESIFPMDELSVMGIAEVIPKVRQLLRRIKQTAAAIHEVKPTALITIDSPDFCFRVAIRAKALMPDLRVIHYIAPSVWAWRPKRAAKMAKFVDHVLALLPFEPPYMEAEGMTCDFVGHPITTEQQATSEQAIAFRNSLNMENNVKLLTLLPGSRTSEVRRLGPVFCEVVELLREDYPRLSVVIPSVGARFDQIQQIFDGVDVTILDPRGMSAEASEVRKRACYAASDVALAASGTVSLELAAAQTPMVIAYEMHWFTAFIKRRMVRVSSATLVNLLTKTTVVPEFLLKECKADKIYESVKELLENEQASQKQLDASAQAMRLLGKDSLNEGNRAAISVLDFINHK